MRKRTEVPVVTNEVEALRFLRAHLVVFYGELNRKRRILQSYSGLASNALALLCYQQWVDRHESALTRFAQHCELMPEHLRAVGYQPCPLPLTLMTIPNVKLRTGDVRVSKDLEKNQKRRLLKRAERLAQTGSFFTVIQHMAERVENLRGSLTDLRQEFASPAQADLDMPGVVQRYLTLLWLVNGVIQFAGVAEFYYWYCRRMSKRKAGK